MQTFLSECGASGPIQLIAQNPASGDTLRRTVEQPFAVIGRNPKADVPLSDEEISHRHAYLQIYEGRVFCVDLKSRTGTHWEDGPQEYGWLEGKQAIRVGSYRIRRVDGEEATEEAVPLVSRPLTPLGMTAVSLEFLPRKGDPEVDEPLAHWKMQRVLALVGRGSTCKVRLVHPSVSRVHCSLVRTPLGLWVIDLLGRKGTLVNGAPVSFALLEDGDRLQIGRFQVRVRYEPHPDPDSTEGKDWEDFAVEEAEADSPSQIVMVSSAPSETPEPKSSPDLSPLSAGGRGDGGEGEQGSAALVPSTLAPLPQRGEGEQQVSDDLAGGGETPIQAAETNPMQDEPAPSPHSPEGREDSQVEVCRTDFQSVSTPARIENPSHESLIPSPPVPLQPAEEEPQVSTALAPSPSAVLHQREEGRRRRSSRKRALVRSSNRALSKAEWMETILPAITDQFAQMQQQMFDQFQQGMFMMFRTFGQLHREQMDMVRQELDRIHQLTQQLHELQMELAKHPAAASDPAVREMLSAISPVSPETPLPEAAAVIPPEQAWEAALRAKIEEREGKIEKPHDDLQPVTPAFTGSEDRLQAELQTEPQDESRVGVPASAGNEDRLIAELQTSESQEESPLIVPASAGNEHRLKAELQTTESQDESPVGVPASAGNEDKAELQTTSDPPSSILDPHFAAPGEEDEEEITPSEPTAPALAQTEDIHVLLCRQIAALQKERQSRWQRVLRFLTGKSSSKPMP